MKDKGKKGSQGATAKVSRADVERIAQLAELAVDDAAATELEVQLSRILDYVAQLGELPPDAGGWSDERAARLRKDEPGQSDPLARRPEEWAPAMKGGLFVMPRPDQSAVREP